MQLNLIIKFQAVTGVYPQWTQFLQIHEPTSPHPLFLDVRIFIQWGEAHVGPGPCPMPRELGVVYATSAPFNGLQLRSKILASGHCENVTHVGLTPRRRV